MILLSLKHGWSFARRREAAVTGDLHGQLPGNCRRTVGLFSFDVIARKLVEFLKPHDLDVLVYDPHLPAEVASEFGVELVTLDQLFQRSDAISIHTPLLIETVGLITGKHLSSIEPATFSSIRPAARSCGRMNCSMSHDIGRISNSLWMSRRPIHCPRLRRYVN